MARVRKIPKGPGHGAKNYFVVDACFLVEKYLAISSAPSEDARKQLRESKRWWDEIDRQTGSEHARIYVPDLCIAEAFKVLAKKRYREEAFPNAGAYKKARQRLSADVSVPHKLLRSQRRYIRCHDLAATRDIIIAVDRFYELFMKHKLNVGVIDLIVVASAKYLMDFFDIPRSQLHIITMDNALWRGTKKITELPNAYNPRESADAFDRVFR